MPFKCCVFGCKTNYLTDTTNVKYILYSFPKDQEKLERWINAMPNKFSRITTNMKICSKHWPSDVKKEKPYRSKVPVSLIIACTLVNAEYKRDM